MVIPLAFGGQYRLERHPGKQMAGEEGFEARLVCGSEEILPSRDDVRNPDSPPVLRSHGSDVAAVALKHAVGYGPER
jgi:hypothetical protein